jgi:hypothetical protein
MGLTGCGSPLRAQPPVGTVELPPRGWPPPSAAGTVSVVALAAAWYALRYMGKKGRRRAMLW